MLRELRAGRLFPYTLELPLECGKQDRYEQLSTSHLFRQRIVAGQGTRKPVPRTRLPGAVSEAEAGSR